MTLEELKTVIDRAIETYGGEIEVGTSDYGNADYQDYLAFVEIDPAEVRVAFRQGVKVYDLSPSSKAKPVFLIG